MKFSREVPQQPGYYWARRITNYAFAGNLLGAMQVIRLDHCPREGTQVHTTIDMIHFKPDEFVFGDRVGAIHTKEVLE